MFGMTAVPGHFILRILFSLVHAIVSENRIRWLQSSGNPSGAMAADWVKDSGNWYYMYPSGEMATGWLLDGETWYYLQQDGTMAVGECLIGDTWYVFGDNGALIG